MVSVPKVIKPTLVNVKTVTGVDEKSSWNIVLQFKQ